MANLGEFFTDQAKKLGIPEDDANVKALVTKLATQEIDDSIVSKFNTSFMTMDSAKNNPLIQDHFFATILNGLDKQVETVLSDSEFTDEIRAEIKAEKSLKKFPLLLKKVKELEAAKAGANKGDKAEFTKQIADLNTQILAEKTASQNARANDKADYDNRIKDMVVDSSLSTHKYSDQFGQVNGTALAKMHLQNELKAKGLRLVQKDNSIVLETEAGTEYFENNVKIGFKDFSDKVVAQHKLIAVNTPPTTPPVVVVPGVTGKNTFQEKAQALADSYPT